MTKKQTSIITGIILVIILLGFMVSGRLWFMLDLTSNKSHTISDISRNLHREIPNTVKITYYVSDKLKSAVPWPEEVIDLLRLYVSYSRGKIHLSIVDPVKERMDYRIEQLGIIPREIQSLEQDQASFTIIYSGITIEYLEKTEVMPFVSSLETLEYDITARIRSLVSNTTRTLGVIIGETSLEWDRNFLYLRYFFGQAGYNLRLLHYFEEIPANINVLFVIGGAETFDESILRNIDKYIQNGGKALFAVNGFYVNLDELKARPYERLGLLDMLSHYGIDVVPQLVLEYSNLLYEYMTPTHGGAELTNILQYPFWLKVSPENMNLNHLICEGMNELHMYWANPLEVNLPENSNIEVTELFGTGNEAWLMASPYYISPDLDFTYNRDKAKTQGKRTLAAGLSGIFPSFFNDDIYIDEEEQEKKQAGIIVVGNSFFITDFLRVTQENTDINIRFLIKAADWLGGDEDIMGIRARIASNKLDKLANEPDKEAAAITFVQTVNVIIMPLIVVFTGLFFIMWRRSKTRAQANETSDELSENDTGENDTGGENDI